MKPSSHGIQRGKLAAVLAEARRVLKDSGVLVFTCLHSRQEGWSSVLDALMRSELRVVAAHPIKAEMSVAMPKNQAKDPIDFDIIMVCRKVASTSGFREVGREEKVSDEVAAIASEQIGRLVGRKRKLSRNDVRVIVMAQVLRHLTISGFVEVAMDRLASWEQQAETLITALHGRTR